MVASQVRRVPVVPILAVARWEMETTIELGGRALARRGTFAAALVAGQLGGLAFLGVWLFAYAVWFRGLPWTWPLRVIASFALGSVVLESPTALTYVVAVILNQLVALFWSGAFGWLVVSAVFRPRLATNVVAGLGLGLAAAIVDTILLVPPFFGILQDMDPWWRLLDRGWDLAAHVAFGMTTGWFFEVFRPRTLA